MFPSLIFLLIGNYIFAYYALCTIITLNFHAAIIMKITLKTRKSYLIVYFTFRCLLTFLFQDYISRSFILPSHINNNFIQISKNHRQIVIAHSKTKNIMVITDREYESYNKFDHIKQKG